MFRVKKTYSKMKRKNAVDEVHCEHSECSTTIFYLWPKGFPMGSMQCLVLTFFHIVLAVDRNKGDIKRNVCMDSVDLRRVDGHLFRKMKIAWVIHLANVCH